MNIILGSGINALLARHILGPDWKIIPDGPSRFYFLNPSPADNFVYASPLLRPLEGVLSSFLDMKRYPYKCAFDVDGTIVPGYDPMHCTAWLSKVFGWRIPTHYHLILSNRMSFEVYGTRVNQLYTTLYEKYRGEIVESSQNSMSVNDISSISDREMTIGSKRIQFEKCISTIPYEKTARLVGSPSDEECSYVDMTVIKLSSPTVDTEGHNQLWIVNPMVDFFKVTLTKPGEFLFFFTGKVANPGSYLSNFVELFDLESSVYIQNAIPAGNIIQSKWLHDHGIIPVGMSAQWDVGMDISSCLYRILKVADGEYLT